MNFRSFTHFVVLVAAVAVCNAATPPRRIYSEIKTGETFRLLGNTKPKLAQMRDLGEVSHAQVLPRITMHFAMTDQQLEDLDQLLRQQQSPSSPQYHKFLTPEEYGARFGLNPEDIAKVTAWLQGEGFSEIAVARGQNFVTFSGTTGQVQNAFHASIHKYSLNGETNYANASDPLVPKALAGAVASIGGLHNFHLKPMGIRKSKPHFTSSVSGDHFLAPDDFAIIYNIQPLYQSGLDGTGVKIAVVGESDVQLSDIRAFRTAAGLPKNDPTIIVVGTDPGLQSSSGDESESDLDLEWSGGIARSAQIVFVTAVNAEDSVTYAIDNNIAPILSTSYGLCEAQTAQTDSDTQFAELQQANAQGITVVAAAGDSGAADCDTGYPATQGLAVDEPASFQNVTGVGGTMFNEGSGTYWNTANNSYGGSGISYIPEVGWNESSASNGLEAGGGGASIYNTKPPWQTGNGVPNDGARDVPDISFSASPDVDGYLMCSDGDCVNGFRNTDTTLDVIGGTSCGTPSFAGIVALLVQKSGPQGNINPSLYSLASSSTDAFHDITSGSNAVACTIGTPNCTSGSIGYSATPGYDLASGWGSVDAYHLVTEWPGVTNVSTANTSEPLGYVPLATPCRAVDTRNPAGDFGGPELSPGEHREFELANSGCGVPATAVAYSVNVTAVPDAELGLLTIWPSGQARPEVSTLNSDGRVKADAAIVVAGTNGGVDVYASDSTQVVIDISGYFEPLNSSSGLQFYPLTPCRIVDTRYANGSLGSPYLTGGQARTFPILSSGCNIPGQASAYSLNFTTVPHAPIGFFTAWPAGQSQPATSILNASTGSVTANAAIITAGSAGSITTYSSNDTDLVIDINGYFAPAGAGGLSFYSLAPCRVIDTRNPAGTRPFSGTLTVNVTGSGCGTPSTAQAYVFNATVVPMVRLAT